jgi:hypothetical protein
MAAIYSSYEVCLKEVLLQNRSKKPSIVVAHAAGLFE